VAASTCGVSTKLTANLSSPSPPCSKLLCSRFDVPEGKELHTLALLPFSSQGEELLIWGLFTGKEGDCGLDWKATLFFLPAGKTFAFTEEMEIR